MAFALCSPALVVLAIVSVYPVVNAIIMAFQKDQGLDPVTKVFVQGGSAGFDNFVHWLAQQCGSAACAPGTLGAQFWSATGTTFFFAAVTVVLETILGFWMAVIMARSFRGRSALRAAVLVPWAIPTAVTAKLWFFIFAFDGIANKLFGTAILWTGSEWPARWAIMIEDVWKTKPVMALLNLAGRTIIQAEVNEEAKGNGAATRQHVIQRTQPQGKRAERVAHMFAVGGV